MFYPYSRLLLGSTQSTFGVAAVFLGAEPAPWLLGRGLCPQGLLCSREAQLHLSTKLLEDGARAGTSPRRTVQGDAVSLGLEQKRPQNSPETPKYI